MSVLADTVLSADCFLKPCSPHPYMYMHVCFCLSVFGFNFGRAESDYEPKIDFGMSEVLDFDMFTGPRQSVWVPGVIPIFF